MPTDLSRVIKQRRAKQEAERRNSRLVILLIPAICCLLTILLAFESRAFEAAFVTMGGPQWPQVSALK